MESLYCNVQVYKHYNNLQVDHFLSAVLILALALVIGLGIGHFLGKYLVKTASHTCLTKLQEFSIQLVEVFTPKCSV